MLIINRKQQRGFTLLEILIALFIFTILSTMLVGALHNVMGIEAQTEKNAQRLRDLQLVLLMMSGDIKQAVPRPVWDASGKMEAAFVGAPQEFTLTHTGLANPDNALARSSLHRVRYTFHASTLSQVTWTALDLAPNAKAHTRMLLDNVADARFEYLDQSGRFYPNWPVQDKKNEILPKAVRITLTINNWGNITQLYVIAAEPLTKSPTTSQS